MKSKFSYNGWGIALGGEGSWSFGDDCAIILGFDNNFWFSY